MDSGYTYSKSSGFSLVELSIVLTILGLLIGGILSGQSLIEFAKVKSQISQIDEFRVATGAFQLKYNGLPGDLPNAANNGLTADVTGGGNGDGAIIRPGYGNYGPYWACYSEPLVYWTHLSQSGFLNGTFTDNGNASTVGTSGAAYPVSKFDVGIMVVASGAFYGIDGYKNYFYIGFTPTNCGWQRMAPSILSSLDQKLDDGLPLSGKIQARSANNGALSSTEANGGTTSCITSTSAATARYTVTSEASACVGQIQAEF